MKQNRIARTLFSVSGLILLGKLMGFVKQMVVASAFGATIETDLINLSHGFIGNLQYLLVQSSVTSVVSIYIHMESKREEDARRFAGDAVRALALISAEIAVDIIKQMDSPDMGDDTVTKAYSSLLSEAAKYGSLKKSEARYTAILEKLSQSPEEVAADSRRVYAKLRAADGELAALTEEIDQYVQTLAADNHLDISTNRDTMDGSLQVVISHTHTVSEPEDIFLVTTLFCGLIGIFCGGFFAVCKEAFAEKKKKA